MQLRVSVLPGGYAPEYQTEFAAGMDLRCTAPAELAPGERKLIGTGIKVAIPNGFEGQVRPRSGLAYKLGLSVVNSPGTIDSDYRGEVKVLLINLGADVVKLDQGERIAQLVISPVMHVNVMTVDESELGTTERGEGGYGSTGTK